MRRIHRESESHTEMESGTDLITLLYTSSSSLSSAENTSVFLFALRYASRLPLAMKGIKVLELYLHRGRHHGEQDIWVLKCVHF